MQMAFDQTKYIECYLKDNIKQVRVSLNKRHDADVIEWTLDHPEYSVTDTFMQIQNAAAEADLTGSFSLANFIQGVFQAVQNHWNQEPNRILISKSN